MYYIMSAAAILAGLCFAVQAPVNTALGRRTNSFQASTISFFVGTLLLALLVMMIGKGDLHRITDVQLWQLLGGPYGAFSVWVTVTALPVLGVALTITMNMFGQLIMGAVIDAFGLFAVTAIPIQSMRVIGLIFAAVGIILIYRGSMNRQAIKIERGRREKIAGNVRLMGVLAFLSGVVSAIQSPTNASLAAIVGNWEGTMYSFLFGFLPLLMITLIKNRGKILPIVKVGIKPWMFLGGALGLTGIFLNIWVVPDLGSALQVAGGLTGQLTGGIIIDSIGIIETEKRRITPMRCFGVLAIMAGGIIVAMAKSSTC